MIHWSVGPIDVSLLFIAPAVGAADPFTAVGAAIDPEL